MKIAKPYKILALLIVLFVSTALLIAFSFKTSAYADNASDYFSGGTVEFSDDKAQITVGDSGSVSIKNKLDLSDFAIKIYLPDLADTETFKIKFVTEPYYATGNPKTEGGDTVYKTEIENEIVFTMDGTTLKAAFNGHANTAVAGYAANSAITATVNSTANAGYLSAKLFCGVNETDLGHNADNYYKIKLLPMVGGTVSFACANEKVFKIETINQKYSAGTDFAANEFVQDFVRENDGFKNKATAKVYLPSSVYEYADATAFKAIYGYNQYSASLTAYSFLNSSVSDYKVVAGENSGVKVESDNVIFNSKSATATDYKKVEIKKGEKVVNSFDFYVREYSEDTVAPVYNGDAVAIASFDEYVKDLVKTADDEDKTEITIEKSKLSSLVTDEISNFAQLTATVYYWSDNSDSSSSSLKISLKGAGHFRFIIIFSDLSNNVMEKEQFFFTDSEDTLKEIRGVYGKDAPAGVGNYVFEFDFIDDSKLKITTGSAGTGYKGVEYSCSAFTIEGNDYTAEYSLFYSATEIGKDADGWKEIVSVSKATDEDKTYGDFTYDEIKAINYDGTLDFTPDRTGYYKLVCKVNSTDSISGDESAVVFEVKEQVKTVTPDTHWLKNNVWSVVFLSVGTLSLIGIIVLLFIKPKDEVSDDE